MLVTGQNKQKVILMAKVWMIVQLFVELITLNIIQNVQIVLQQTPLQAHLMPHRAKVIQKHGR